MTTSPAARDLVAEGQDVVEQLITADRDPVELATGVITWAHEEFGQQLCVLSSMGDEALVHLVAEVAPGMDVVFIDTGYHFPETLGTRDAYAADPRLNIINVVTRQTVAEQDDTYGPRLYDRAPDQCCALRKVEPLNRALTEYQAWMSGMRRVDAPTRADIQVVEFDAKRNKVKINPLALWDDDTLDSYVESHGVLLNPLRQLGYPSIGCQPCTRPVEEGENARAGRWAGQTKTECGLHT